MHGWGRDNPNWETQNLDPNWTKLSEPIKHTETHLSDYAKHVQECFRKTRCIHQRFFSPEDECLLCRAMYDERGNLIQQGMKSPSTPPVSPLTISETEDRSPTPEPSLYQINEQANEFISQIVEAGTYVDMVFPDLPYLPRENRDEATERRDMVRDVAILARAAFPANYQTTYADAWRRYKNLRGYCQHNLVYRLHRDHCKDCEEYSKMLEGRHAADYQKEINKSLATF